MMLGHLASVEGKEAGVEGCGDQTSTSMTADSTA